MHRSVILLFVFAGMLAAQGQWLFRNRGYYDPLIAEPRPAQVHVLALARSDEVPFVTNPGARGVWDITLGKEIPITGYQNTDVTNRPLGAGKWGIGVWAPISFHMMEDFKDESNPILNTDYRFAGSFKAQYGLKPNLRIGGKVQIGHESTHLGDEFVVAAERREPGRFLRVNVSYEYWHYGASLEGTNSHGDWIVRHEGIGLLDTKKGYYSAELLFPDDRTITPSTRNFEPGFGFQYRFDWDSTSEEPWRPFVSIDARDKTVYNYFKTPGQKDDSQMSWNILVGMYRRAAFQQPGVPYIYFRWYHGVNPHGQFRSQRDYDLIGIGVHFSL
jgi:hypothetical protein